MVTSGAAHTVPSVTTENLELNPKSTAEPMVSPSMIARVLILWLRLWRKCWVIIIIIIIITIIIIIIICPRSSPGSGRS